MKRGTDGRQGDKGMRHEEQQNYAEKSFRESLESNYRWRSTRVLKTPFLSLTLLTVIRLLSYCNLNENAKHKSNFIFQVKKSLFSSIFWILFRSLKCILCNFLFTIVSFPSQRLFYIRNQTKGQERKERIGFLLKGKRERNRVRKMKFSSAQVERFSKYSCVNFRIYESLVYICVIIYM